jgi:hypothetical protein
MGSEKGAAESVLGKGDIVVLDNLGGCRRSHTAGGEFLRAIPGPEAPARIPSFLSFHMISVAVKTSRAR